MKKLNDIMIDLETLGTTPGAAILSIAAVRFDINTGETGEVFFTQVSLGSCMDAGLIIEPDTLQWWMQKSTEARDALFGNTISLRDALISFNGFYNKGEKIWGNGASFDLALMRSAYKKAKIPQPWHFREERCLRTLVALHPAELENHTYHGTKHHPVDDCLNQIEYAYKTWKAIKKDSSK